MSYIYRQMSIMTKIERSGLNKMEKEFKTFLKRIAPKESVESLISGLTFRQFFSHRMLVVTAIRQGVTQSFFMSIKEATPFSEVEWSDFLDISIKSLQRYKKDKNHVFKSIHSEKIIELAEVNSMGLDVFDSSDKFSLWLNTPSYALGSMRPLELLRDSYGKEIVMNELNRIDQGVFV
ncbi:MAG: putative toxin-antitoxin system antitoxin component (TIGR02293 family) [Litorivivens sp.]|jgi:putative toxin-antitoxin system antitoxin component (TIGR02293 family)